MSNYSYKIITVTFAMGFAIKLLKVCKIYNYSFNFIFCKTKLTFSFPGGCFTVGYFSTFVEKFKLLLLLR